MYYGHYDEAGRYIGFYPRELFGKLIPLYNTEPITEEITEEIEVPRETEDDPITTETVTKTIIHEPGTVQVGEAWDLSDVPEPYVELNETEWQEALSGEYRVVDGVHSYYPPIITLVERQQQKVVEVNAAVADYITSGFQCGAYRYDSQLEDQANLQTAVLGAIAALTAVSGAPAQIPYRCYLGDTDEKDIILHTPAEMMTVFAAWGDHLSTATAIGNTLKKQIASALTLSGLELVQWPDDC